MAAFWEDDGGEVEDVFWECEEEVVEEEAEEEDVDARGDEAEGVGLAGEGRGDVQQDFADEFEWEVGPDFWGERWVRHFWNLARWLWVSVWLVTRRVAKVAYSLVSQSQSQRYES